MATYLILGLFITAAAAFGILIRRTSLSRRHVRPYVVTVIALFVLTAVFDNLIVGAGIVGYDRSKILGLYVGFAPVEDFFYPLVAAFMLPILWNKR